MAVAARFRKSIVPLEAKLSVKFKLGEEIGIFFDVSESMIC
jgi:hypothetical protein